MTLRRDDGFTLVEILVVVLVIGVLAVIAVPVFAGQRVKAQDANAKSLAAAGAAAVETHHVEEDDYALTTAALRDEAPELDQAAGWSLTSAGGSYRVSVRSRSGTSFTIGRTAPGAPLDRGCDAPGRGGCGDDRSW